MRRKIYVTASEMMELRNQGMSNHDIAKALDISYNTVRRYIGSQGGKKMERLEAFKDKPKETKQPEAPVFVPYAPKVLKEEFDVLDDVLIEVDYESKAIFLSSSEGEITVPFKDVYKLTQFFAWLLRERNLNTEGGADGE